jgi:hypothetical protein
MSQLIGADIADLRGLAAQFDRIADRMEATAANVGGIIGTSAWQGPDAAQFRSNWAGVHSSELRTAARLLRENASKVRSNADDQERTSSIDGAWSGPVGNPGPGGMPAPGVPGPDGVPAPGDPGTPWWDTAREYWSDYGLIRAPLSLAAAVAGLGFLATSVRGTTQLSSLASALAFSPTYTALTNAKNVMSFGSTAGKAFGWIGVGLNGVDTVTAIADGDVGGAIWSGAKTAIGVGALLAPPPANLVFAGVGAGIAIGEFAYEHWDQITAVANTVADGAVDLAHGVADVASDVASGVADVASDVASGVADAAGDFVDGVGDVADDLWPF